MFLFSCKYVSNSPVKRTVDSILEFHPNEKIVIVDSQSDDQTYDKIFVDYNNVEILYNINKHRVPGAFYQVCKRYPEEPYYVNIQDCVLIKKSLQPWIDSSDEFISFMYFHDWVQEKHKEEYQYMERVLSGTKYEGIIPEPSCLGQETFYGCFGPLYIIKNSLMKKIMNSGVLEKMKSTCKLHDELGERLFGLIASYEGYPPEKYNIEGDFKNSEKYSQLLSDNLEYFTKIFLGRQ